MFHTVYNSFEEGLQGRDYIGKHSTENPYDEYLGSFKDDTFHPDSKIIMGYSKTPEGAVWLEMMWQKVFNVVEDPQYVNRSYQTSNGFVSTHPETRRKISEAMSGENNPWYGKKRVEHSARMSGEGNPFYGKKHSEETKKSWSEKYSGENARFFGRKHTEESLQRMSDWQRGVPKGPSTPEAKKAISEGVKGLLFWVNEEGSLMRSRTNPGEGWKRGKKWK